MLKSTQKIKGSIFIITILVITFLVTICFAFVSINQVGLKIVASQSQSGKILQSAQAGLADALYNLKDNLYWNTGFNEKVLPNNEGEYTLTFDKTLGIAYSTNNLGESVSVSGWSGRIVPARSMHLVSIGAYNNNTQNAEIIFTVPGVELFKSPLFADSQITIKPGFFSDSFNSILGNYRNTRQNKYGDIKTNAVSAGVVNISGTVRNRTQISGNIYVGVNGDPNTAILISGLVNISGSKLAAPNQANLTQINAAEGTQNMNYTRNGQSFLSPGVYKDLSVDERTLNLSPGVYVFRNINLTNGGKINIPSSSSAPTLIYFTGNMDIANGVIQNRTNKSTNLVFYGTDSANSVKLSGGNRAYYALYARKADVSIAQDSEIFGSVQGKTILANNGVSLHFDQALNYLTVKINPNGDSLPMQVISNW
ncbi:MAG: hypothetical protein HYU63_05720 [Armatimonadetes bacterium]|nr:hypothetical protein [Armatimonadota bacterium]